MFLLIGCNVGEKENLSFLLMHNGSKMYSVEDLIIYNDLNCIKKMESNSYFGRTRNISVSDKELNILHNTFMNFESKTETISRNSFMLLVYKNCNIEKKYFIKDGYALIGKLKKSRFKNKLDLISWTKRSMINDPNHPH